jgi:hypothetical protein
MNQIPKSNQLQPSKRLLSLAKFCKLYGLGHTEFYRWRRRQLTLPFFRHWQACHGNGPLISADEGERWAAPLPKFATTLRHRDILSSPWINSDEFKELLHDFRGRWKVVPVHSIWLNFCRL